MNILIDDNIYIEKSDEYQLWLKSGCQYFKVGVPVDDREDALWFAEMLKKALNNIAIERRPCK